MNKEFYALSATDITGKEVAMGDFAGQVLLIVNTASKCGFTPQYAGLEELYKKYKDRGFAVLGFPCDQFAHQEPGDASEIKEFCSINYGVTFPLFKKIEVNGPGTHPVYEYLKKKLPTLLGKRIKWNFTKFLLDRNGSPVKRFSPSTPPSKLVPTIEALLAKDPADGEK